MVDGHTALQNHLISLGAETMAYGPPLTDGTQVEIIESFDGATDASGGGSVEGEYAAMRQRVGVMHLPQRVMFELAGADAKDYLHRLCTQEVNKLTAGRTARAFQLDDKGRIAADLIVHDRGGAVWVEVDVFDRAWLLDLIEKRLFTEDVTVHAMPPDGGNGGERVVFWLMGPAAVRLLGAVAGPGGGERVAALGAEPGTHGTLDLPLGGGGSSAVLAYRYDVGGVLGVRLAVPAPDAAAVHGTLLDAAGYEPAADPDAAYAARRRDSLRGRPVGWSAFNTLRIEEGVPLYHVDFGPDSLPAETGLLDEAVSFTKGCYLGQEVVARMKSLGHPKKLLVGLRVEGDGGAAVPVAGSQVVEPGDKQKVIGGVTSSTASPLLGQKPVALAMVRWGRHRPGTEVAVPADGRLVAATVQPTVGLTRA